MKKFAFIFAALFTATFANAQITLEHTFDGWFTISANMYGDIYHYVQAPYFYNMIMENPNSPSVPEPATDSPRRAIKNTNTVTVELYDTETFELYKTVEVEVDFPVSIVTLVTRNIMSTDNKVCFCLTDESYTNEKKHSYIYNEDGKLIATINGSTPTIAKANGKYIMITRDQELDEQQNEVYKTRIYSLPGNGDDIIATPSSPKRSSRKIARDGQVLVETEQNTFTLTGTEVK